MYIIAVVKVRMSCGYLIVEFHDGLQLIPAVWYNADKQSCIWPSHYKTKLRINTAIIKQEIHSNNKTKNESDWEELSIKRIFGNAETYEKGIIKLVTAQDTFNVENNEISSDELRQRKKRKRRINAKKYYSSSSDEENKENRQIQKKRELSPPQIQDFISSTPIINMENIENTSHKETSANIKNSMNSNSVNRQSVPSGSAYSAEKTVFDADEENYVSHEFKKQILFKLNKLLYKLDTMQNKMNLIEGKLSYSININEELDIKLPILSQEELKLFEEQLEDEIFKNQVVNILKLVGGSNPHVMTRNILKKVLTNTLAEHFSCAGKKAKRNFKDLKLANVIIRQQNRSNATDVNEKTGLSQTWKTGKTRKSWKLKLVMENLEKSGKNTKKPGILPHDKHFCILCSVAKDRLWPY